MPNQTTLEHLDVLSGEIYEFSKKPLFLVECLSIIVNIFHVFILTRKSMRTNCINVLMAGIGISDLFVMVYTARSYIQVVTFNYTTYLCTPPPSFISLVTELVLAAFLNNFRRLSAWFSLLMACVRYFAVKNASSFEFDFLSKPIFGVTISSISFLLSSLLASLFYIGMRIKESITWTPPETCQGFSPGFSAPSYTIYLTNVLFADKSQDIKLFGIIDGAAKIIPTAIFPIATFLLVTNLRNADEMRRKASTNQSKEENSKADQTTKLVILIAVCYMIAEGPLAIVIVIFAFAQDTEKYSNIVSNVTNFWNIFLAVNTITHFFVCLLVSSQYQKTVKNLIGCNKKRSSSKNTSVITVRSSRS